MINYCRDCTGKKPVGWFFCFCFVDVFCFLLFWLLFWLLLFFGGLRGRGLLVFFKVLHRRGMIS